MPHGAPCIEPLSDNGGFERGIIRSGFEFRLGLRRDFPVSWFRVGECSFLSSLQHLTTFLTTEPHPSRDPGDRDHRRERDARGRGGQRLTRRDSLRNATRITDMS